MSLGRGPAIQRFPWELLAQEARTKSRDLTGVKSIQMALERLKHLISGHPLTRLCDIFHRIGGGHITREAGLMHTSVYPLKKRMR